jgi:hypothetical protein
LPFNNKLITLGGDVRPILLGGVQAFFKRSSSHDEEIGKSKIGRLLSSPLLT